MIVEDDNSVPSTHGGDVVDPKWNGMAGAAAVMSCRKRTAGPAAACA